MAIIHTIKIKNEKTNKAILDIYFGGNNIFNTKFYKNLNIDDKIDWKNFCLKDTKIDYRTFIIEFFRTTAMYLGLNSNENLKNLLCLANENDIIDRLYDQIYYNNMYQYLDLLRQLQSCTKECDSQELENDLGLYISLTGKPDFATYTYYDNLKEKINNE